ncbi:4'-phosphopantetheinyl transferase family protein [Dyadobacter sandarakinus]|uniref:4'-phosphopantetheinyl transferase superfamily protein n=1 Tax=Dyadobacter sandarakinus TaxID=2747268 RepID=A0ABX7IFU5_9BACT|nr:4'-phosphopantetheinyl transferase superfamily protein [Dyadobacter sandarakinus]QRR03963.1 4'-phosphopantetheinyl transferase superfamily protein [Dyadobacter sandarakinus]
MPVSSIKTISEETYLGLWKMTESWQQLAAALDLTESEQQQLNEKRTDLRKLEWTSCRALLKAMTGGAMHIVHDENRKPHLERSDYAVSLSHSGEYACIYVSRKRDVGTDIQKMKPSIAKGSDYFLHETEQQWVNMDDNLLLHLIWSAKEAAFKYAGDPELDLKKHIVTSRFESNQKEEIEVSILKKEPQTVRMAFENFDDYVLTWTC